MTGVLDDDEGVLGMISDSISTEFTVKFDRGAGRYVLSSYIDAWAEGNWPIGFS